MSKNNQAQNKKQAENKQEMYNRADNNVPNRAHTEMKNQPQNKKNDTNCR